MEPTSPGLRSRTIRLLCGQTEGLPSQTNAVNQASESRVGAQRVEAGTHAALGENTQAMAWLERGYDERFNPGVLQ
jgi:hypothetical protein